MHHTLAMDTEKLLNVKITTNVRSEQNKLLRLTPLFIKNMALKYVYSQVGDVLSPQPSAILACPSCPRRWGNTCAGWISSSARSRTTAFVAPR
ncbi:MAG: hypothetical protein R2912_07875 [Eubacteriales bacterium]